MKKLISFFTVFVFLFAMCLTANAQLANTYLYSTSTGGVIDPMVGSTQLIGSGVDDAPSSLTNFPAGFSFTYEGTVYTQFTVTPDGFCKLGAPVGTAEFANSIVSANNRPKVFPLWDDFATGSAAGGGKVHYLLTGVTPNQIFKIEWFVTIPRNTSGAANSRFQLWLYENGRIDFVYGTLGTAPSSSVGINSVVANLNNYESVTISTNTMSTAVPNNSNAVSPASGRVYTFNPPPPPVQFDAGISASNLNNGRLFSVGKCYDFTATVTNYGTDPLPAGIPVSYTVNGGAAVGPVMTTAAIPVAGTEVVSFTGGLGFCPTGPGANKLDIYTHAGPPIANRPAFSVVVNVSAKLNTFPYVETFAAPVGWTFITTVAGGSVVPWTISACTNPDGLGGNLAAKSDFFSGTNSTGRVSILRSPEFDFTNLANPVLHFYIAHRPFTGGEQDGMEVLVSTDGGLTFAAAATPYNKTSTATDPALATATAIGTNYAPTAEGQWRHETVDLSNFAGNPNVVIGWRATSDWGNNAWVDNVIISNHDGLCTDNVAPAPGAYNCDPEVTLDFTATPLPPQNGNTLDNASHTPKTVVKSEEEGTPFPGIESEIPSLPVTHADNPNGGTAFVTKYYNQDPGQSINPNGAATNPNGGVFTPAEVYWLNTDWYTTTYDGNDFTGYATYNIRINVAGMGFTSVGDLYIVKRTDRTGNWTCLTTTSPATDVLQVSGLTDFCDFAIAGNEVQPVELASFTSLIAGRDVTLNWTTNTEDNNAGFDIERKAVGTENWTKISNVAGNGNSSTPINYVYTDRGLNSGKYNYRLKQIDINGNFEYFALSNEVNIGVPTKFDLSQNYPNPFNPTTNINYDIPFDGKVNLTVFDMSGREVATLVNEVKTAGYYTLNFNGANLSSGVYFYRISADANGQNFVSTKKMTLIK